MKAKELEQGMDYEKRKMYWFDRPMDIAVEEKQDNGTLDRTILHYTVRDGDRAYFSEEYLPEGMSKDGVKMPDITAILESSAERRVKWYIYDMKDTVINAKTALKLCNQWHSGIEHIESRYLNDLDGYHVESSLGVISRFWSRDMLQKEKAACEEKLNQAGGGNLLTARKSRPKQVEYRQKIKAVQFILDGIFVDENITGGMTSYAICHVCMATADKITYMAEMDIKL